MAWLLNATQRTSTGGSSDASRFCLVDTDIVFFADPLPYISRYPFVIAADHLNRLNSGFFCADVRSAVARLIAGEYVERCRRWNFTHWCVLTSRYAVASV